MEMAQKFLVGGFFYNAAGERVGFSDMRMPADRAKKMKLMLDIQRRLREEGCRPVLRLIPV